MAGGEESSIFKYSICPELLSPVKNSTKATNPANLVWSKTCNNATYIVNIASDSSFVNIIKNESIADTSATISGLANNVKYYWRVRAISGNDTSNWSQIWNFKTINSAKITRDMRWQNPLPQGNSLNSTSFSSLSEGWAVGELGTIYIQKIVERIGLFKIQ